MLDFEVGDFQALRPNCYRNAHAQHTVSGSNAPQHSIPKFFKGQIRTRKIPLPQRFAQQQNLETHFQATRHYL